MTTPGKDALMAVLDTVHDPELRRSIVRLNMVRDVAIDGGHVTIAVKLTTAGCPLKDEIQRRVTTAVEPMDGVTGVTVRLEAMTDEERAALRHGIGGGPGHVSPFKEGARTKVIGVGSGKGGVGKSSVTANLAVALAERGHTVGVLDADVYGYSIPRMMGIHRSAVMVEDLMLPVEAHGVRLISMGFLAKDDSPVIWRGPLLHKALTSFVTDVFWDDPDFLLIDLPPGTGDVALTMSQLIPTAHMVIVTTPQLTAQKVASRSAAMARRVGLPVVGVIENMSYFVAPDTGVRYDIFAGGGGVALARDLGVPLLGRVPLESDVARAGDDGLPVVAARPDSVAALEFASCAGAIVDAIGLPDPAPVRAEGTAALG